jgi:peptidyl-prolyl cis-trans isomerase C
LAAAALALSGVAALAQTTPTLATTPATPAPPAVAATVNGEAIYENAVQRGLQHVKPEKRAAARTEIINYLVENVLIDQYLKQMQVNVDPKDVDAKFEKVRTEIQKKGFEWNVWLERMQLTEADLKSHLTADLRWDKYASGVATEKVLRDLFNSEKDTFDGTQVRARHILLTPDAKDPKAVEAARTELLTIKQQLEAKVAAELSKLPANTDAQKRQNMRLELLEKEFGAVASDKSACPSKDQGGDVDYFTRSGSFVEPFAKAAFALKVGEMSDVVQSTFGYHLILVTDRKGPGREIKFEDVKDDVREVYCYRLHEMMVAKARPQSRIEITPVK